MLVTDLHATVFHGRVRRKAEGVFFYFIFGIVERIVLHVAVWVTIYI